VTGICGRIAVDSCAAACLPSAELRVQPEYLRKAPDGKIVAADRDAVGYSQPSAFTGGRLGYASFQVIAKLIAPGEYALELTPPSGLQADVFAWRTGGIRDLLWPVGPLGVDER